MGKLTNGTHGGFVGRVGNVVGYVLNGQHIVRTTPAKRHKKPSEKELLTRNKMTLVSQFLAPIKQVIQFGYKSLAPAGSRIGSFQKAQSSLFKNAVSIDEQGAAILNMSLVTVFVGDLAPVHIIEAKRLPNGDVDLTWHIEDYRYLKATLLLFFYQDEVHNEMVQTAVSMAAGHAHVHLPAAINPHLPVHVYASAFVLYDESLSTSTYVGLL